MSVDEVADLLGWTEAAKAAHLRSLDQRPAKPRRSQIQDRSPHRVTKLNWRALIADCSAELPSASTGLAENVSA
jgi:hypothetical protein